MRRRRRAKSSSAGTGDGAGRVRGRLDAEVLEDRGRDLDDAAGKALESDREHRHERVARGERAVAAPAEVVPAAEVRELEAGRGRDEHVAGARVPKRAPGPGERVRVVEDRRVAARPPAAVLRREAKLLAL